jgi:signal transduction histidine kinase
MWNRILRRWQSSLATRIIGITLLTQAALLPALFVGLDRVAWQSNRELFASMAQGYIARRAGEVSDGRVSIDGAALQPFVAGIVASGFVAYAEVRLPGRVVSSHAATPAPLPAAGVLDSIEPGDDRIYYLSEPWRHGAESGTLVLGFDESFMHERVAGGRRLLLLALFGYLVLVIVAAVLLAHYLTRPLAQLRRAAHRVAAGNMSQALDTSTGIREVDELSQDLERMRRSLEAMAARIYQTQRLETVGTLAGGISHEFNNVLLPIILFLEAALDALPEEHRARPPVARALVAAGRARDIVTKLLVFSRHSAVVKLVPISLAGAVDEALRLFAGVCPSYVTLQTDIDTPTDPVMADTGMIMQIVMNLCTNACQAIPVGGGTITVGLENVVVDGARMVELAVTDSGVGMAGATLSRIFEPFFTTRAVGRGSGLGLAVVHGIVATLHGTISVDSEPGAGSVFRVRLPSVDPEG